MELNGCHATDMTPHDSERMNDKAVLRTRTVKVFNASYITLNISQQIFIEEGGVWIGKQVSLLQGLLFKNLFKMFISGLFGSGEKLDFRTGSSRRYLAIPAFFFFLEDR